MAWNGPSILVPLVLNWNFSCKWNLLLCLKQNHSYHYRFKHSNILFSTSVSRQRTIFTCPWPSIVGRNASWRTYNHKFSFNHKEFDYSSIIQFKKILKLKKFHPLTLRRLIYYIWISFNLNFSRQNVPLAKNHSIIIEQSVYFSIRTPILIHYPKSLKPIKVKPPMLLHSNNHHQNGHPCTAQTSQQLALKQFHRPKAISRLTMPSQAPLIMQSPFSRGLARKFSESLGEEKTAS